MSCCGISHHHDIKWFLRKGDIDSQKIQIRKDCYTGSEKLINLISTFL